MRNPKHLCAEDTCLCPLHGTPMYWWPKGGLHACQDRECEHAQGVDLEALLAKEMWESLALYRNARRVERQHILDFFDSVRFRLEREGRWITYPPEGSDEE